MTVIHESGMDFRFDEDNCFLIEQDDVAKRPNVKACECLAFIVAKNWYAFIEAKSSAPREKACDLGKISYDGGAIDKSWKILTNFDNFISDICQKFEDSFSAYHALRIGYHGNEAKKRIPSGCRGLSNANVRFMLIVNGLNEEYCQPVNDALKRCFRHFLNAWNIPDYSVKTLNADSARKNGILVSASH